MAYQIVLTDEERAVLEALPVSALPIGAYGLRALAYMGNVKTIGDLVGINPAELRRMKNVGPVTIRLINDALADVGLCLNQNGTEQPESAAEVLARMRSEPRPRPATTRKGSL